MASFHRGEKKGPVVPTREPGIDFGGLGRGEKEWKKKGGGCGGGCFRYMYQIWWDK